MTFAEFKKWLRLCGIISNGSVSSVITVTGARSLTSADDGATLVYSGSSDIILLEPAGLSSSFSCTVVEAGTGKVSMGAGSGVGQDNPGSTQGINTFLTVLAVGQDQFAHQNPVPASPVVLLKTAIPFIRFSSWTFGSNGALSLSVALPAAYPAAFVYFPADAIATGVAAGWYYAEFSTTTAGIVYNNRYTSGKPSIPSSKTAFSTSAGSVTAQITTAIQGPNITLPGGSMGPSGYMNIEALWQSNNSANVKAPSFLFAGSPILSGITSMSNANVYSEIDAKLQNTGIAARQVSRAAVANSQTGNITISSIDTAADQTISENGTLATAATGDYMILLRLRISYEYGS